MTFREMVAAYAGVAPGELMALLWRDVDFAGSALTITRAMSAGAESSTKSRCIDVVTIQQAMRHSALATTSSYLHARPASEQAQVFTAAFASSMPEAADRVAV